MGGAAPRILAIDDDPDVRELLSRALEHEGWQVTAADRFAGADSLAMELRPDLVILDVRENGSDRAGFDVARRVRETSDVPIIFCTAAGSEDDRIAGFGVGADDYLVKPFPISELVVRVRAVLRRSGRNGWDVIRVGELVIDERAHVVSYCMRVVELTPLEFGILSLVAGHPGRVVSKRELLDRLWDGDASEVNLVERHVSSLRAKLELVGPRIVHTVRGVGYVLRSV